MTDNVIDIKQFMKTPKEQPKVEEPDMVSKILAAGSPEDALALFDRTEDGKLNIPFEVVKAGMVAITLDMLDMAFANPSFSEAEANTVLNGFDEIMRIAEAKEENAADKISVLLAASLEAFEVLRTKYNVAG